MSRIAAVLVLLFEREGHLRVLLTTRAKRLKVHGGETCLPGGHMEEADGDVIEVTAVRYLHTYSHLDTIEFDVYSAAQRST